MKQTLLILLCIFFTKDLAAQGITKFGQSINTSSDFVNKNGKTGSYSGLNKYGQILKIATLTTDAITSITNTSAICGGNVTSDGGSAITSRGVCWSTSYNPTIDGSHTSEVPGKGEFISNIVGLNVSTTFYVRAYATNSAGTSYGSQVSFTTFKQYYETLSSAVYFESPKEIKDITFGNVHFTKITDGPVNCGSLSTFLAKTIEDAYSKVGSDPIINYNLANPELHRFVEEGINCEVFDISGKYIYYGHSTAFYRIDKNTFGNKVKFLISGIWEGASGHNVSNSSINGVNEMPDLGLLIQVDNNAPHSNFYKVPFVAQETGTYTYTHRDADLVLNIPYWNSILNKAWGLSIKNNLVFAVIYNSIGQAYLSTDSGNSFKCVFSMADTSINATTPADQMVFVDTKPDGKGGFGAIGGHPMKNTLTNPQDYDLWGETLNGSLHSHGGCIDKYSDRLFVVTGDGRPSVGIYYSDDWGYNWTLIKTGNLLPGTYYPAQFVTVIPMEDCILFGCDGMGDGYWRLFRDGGNLLSTVECCYQFTGSNTQLITINGGHCFTQDGTMLGLINPHASDNYTTTKGGIVATKNGHNFRKLYEDSFSKFTFESAEFGRRGLISVNDNNKVLVKAKNGGLITLDLTLSASQK